MKEAIIAYHKLHGPVAMYLPADIEGPPPAFPDRAQAGPVRQQVPHGGREGRVLEHIAGEREFWKRCPGVVRAGVNT